MRFRMRTPLARKNLTHDLRRLVIAVCGIGFAVVLMFMQTGAENALFDSTLQILRKLDGRIILASKAQYALLADQTFPLTRVYQARAVPGVTGAYPLYVECFQGLWKPPSGRSYPIRVLAFEPSDPVLAMDGVNRQVAALREPRTGLADCRSKAKFEFPKRPAEGLYLRGAELCGQEIRVVGAFELGTDFANDGTVLMSTANFARYFPYRLEGQDPLSEVDLGIVHVDPEADVPAVQERLRASLPDDVKVFTKEGFIQHETDFWRRSTPVGYVFMVGTAVGFLVGVIICYQVIHSNISDCIGEFATLKAMGYRNGYFVGVVLSQSLYLSVLSFLPGLAVSIVIYHVLSQWTGLLMALTFWRAAKVFLLTTLMCVVSGCLAIRKVMAADPAELF
jgi:putative ABC transport system permease protein